MVFSLKLKIGVICLFLLAATSAEAVVNGSNSEDLSEEELIVDSEAAQQAEAELTLRRLKSGQLSDDEGLDFLEQVRKIRAKIGKQ